MMDNQCVTNKEQELARNLSGAQLESKECDIKNSKQEYNVDTGTVNRCSVTGRSFKFIKSMRIEPVMFLFMFSSVLNSTFLTNLIMDKGCLLHYNYSQNVCDNLHNQSNEMHRNKVEMIANNYNLYLSFLVPVGAFMVIFLAPWSDKYGRKPLLIYGLIGFVINDMGIILCTIYFHSKLEYVLLSNLFAQLNGGFICIHTTINSYTSEMSDSETRSLKFMLLHIAFELGVTLGALSGGLLYTFYSYNGVFVTMTVCHVLTILWVLFLIPETRGQVVQADLLKKLNDLCSIRHFTNGMKICLKRRENSGRLYLWLLLLSGCCFQLSYMVYTNINYVYTHHMYEWNPTIYSKVWSAFSFSEMIVFLVFSYACIEIFKFSDPLIGIIGCISIIGKNIFLGLAFELRIYYLSNIFGFLHGFGNSAIKSLISKIILEEELGQVFSFLATCEAIIPLLGSAVVAKIFNATVHIFPGACYIAVTIFLIFPLGMFMHILCVKQPELPFPKTA
ncbi:proton-coupled folate transporter isoform X2 [Parasteatoda tepidariorum]|uniref:proton-coupled folate transporter isoform X2 n=1 Tax=Parasteatoda tepidariorum TaxID=114398 RepID=UPI001C71AA89|nr:proton-coupled folate transporter isoform X3 [Parasteatoda tepidariorum]